MRQELSNTCLNICSYLFMYLFILMACEARSSSPPDAEILLFLLATEFVYKVYFFWALRLNNNVLFHNVNVHFHLNSNVKY